MKVMSVFGTRPEAVKMCPLVLALQKHREIESLVCLTGQHREMLRQVMDAFHIREDYNLDIMRPRQTLSGVHAAILLQMDGLLEAEKPDIVLVHGDTGTSFAAALAAFHHQIPVGHVEAGLRTFNKRSPFPEEMNRCLTARIADYHFAPTENNRRNLQREGITRGVYVTGNTVMDAFATTVKKDYVFANEAIRTVAASGQKIVLVTAHRRENWGRALENICRAILALSRRYPALQFIYPVHPNPTVRQAVLPLLSGRDNILLTEPLDVPDMHNLMSRSYLVLTDSGGLQEEAPAFGVPVLVLRTETERPEAVDAGTVKMVGLETGTIVTETARLIDSPAAYARMAHAVNPYGDGKASERIVRHLLENREDIIRRGGERPGR